MKLNQVQVQAFSDPDPAALAAAVQAFLAASGEATFLSIHYAVAAGPIYSALLVYTT